MTLPLHAVYWLVHVPHARPVRGRRGTCSPREVCGRRLSSRQETRVRRRSSSSVPQAGCTSAQRRHCRWSQKPLWPRLPGRPRANGQPTLCPTPVPLSASHAAVITLRHRLQVLRAVAHVAPWWLYPLCMLALLIPACASAGVHGGRMLAARSPCPCPYPCPYPWPCSRPCPSSRTQGAPSWLLFSHGALLARQA